MLADPEVPPVPCNERAKQQNLLCSKSFETSKLKSTLSKSCAKLLTQGCCFKVTFLLLVQQQGSLQSVALMLSLLNLIVK